MKYKLKDTKGRTRKLRQISDESLLLSQEVRNGDVL